MLTDTHTHLYASEFDPDRDHLIKDAINQGVSKFYLPNIDVDSVAPLLALVNKYKENCFPMMGLHPCSVKENVEDQLNRIHSFFENEKFVAVGEIGIDLYWDTSFFSQQVLAFQRQCQWAIEKNLPIVIHTRNSMPETINELRKMNTIPRGIFHCFSGTEDDAKQIIDLGFYLGIGGVLTFKNSGLEKAIEKISLDHLVLETDAPYLAPAPHRGKRNEPAFIKLVAEKLASIKNVSYRDVASITSANAEKIFHP